MMKVTMKMLMKMEKKVTTLMTHHDAQYASPCFLTYAPYYALCPMLPCLSPLCQSSQLFLLSHPLCSQLGTIAFHVACGCHAPNRFGTVNMEEEDYTDARDDCRCLAVITCTRTAKKQKKLKE